MHLFEILNNEKLISTLKSHILEESNTTRDVFLKNKQILQERDYITIKELKELEPPTKSKLALDRFRRKMKQKAEARPKN